MLAAGAKRGAILDSYLGARRSRCDITEAMPRSHMVAIPESNDVHVVDGLALAEQLVRAPSGHWHPPPSSNASEAGYAYQPPGCSGAPCSAGMGAARITARARARARDAHAAAEQGGGTAARTRVERCAHRQFRRKQAMKSRARAAGAGGCAQKKARNCRQSTT